MDSHPKDIKNFSKSSARDVAVVVRLLDKEESDRDRAGERWGPASGDQSAWSLAIIAKCVRQFDPLVVRSFQNRRTLLSFQMLYFAYDSTCVRARCRSADQGPLSLPRRGYGTIGWPLVDSG